MIEIGRKYRNKEEGFGILRSVTKRTLLFKKPFSTLKITFDTVQDLKEFVSELKEVEHV